jgi:hypothetical protein
MNTARPYRHPDEQPRSCHWRVWAGGVPIDVLQASGADFAPFEVSGPLDIELAAEAALEGAVVRPRSRGITAAVEGTRLRFRLERPENLCVEAPGLPTLFLYANPPETRRPDPAAPGVIWFAAGKVHEVGTLELPAGATLYVEEGAVVRGLVRAVRADGIRICGRGIIDGGHGRIARQGPSKLCVLEGCRGVTVEDVILINPHSWMLVLGACEDVHVHNLKEIGNVIGSDGIDVCGSRRVRIEGCCLRNNDDCIAIKSVDSTDKPGNAALSWARDVEDVTVRGCTFWNATAGNVMEVGFELQCARVSGILFEDIDVLCCHGHGAVFSIHNGDRALVENVVWRNIRVEHHYDKLLDFRVLHARYSRDTERGRIRRIRLENIQVTRSVFNPGYTTSLITGWSAESPAEDITLRDVFFSGVKVTTADTLDLFTRHARGVRFE